MSRAFRAGAAAVVASLAIVPPACADWTIGGFIGGAHTRTGSLQLTRPAESTSIVLSPVRYRSESMTPPIYYGYRAAVFPRSHWFGIEGEFIHLKVVADTARDTQISGTLRGQPASGSVRLSSVIERFSISHGVNLLLVNAVARHRAPAAGGGDPRWTVTARVGAGASIPHPESAIGGSYAEGYEWGAFSAQAAAGLEVRLLRRVSVLAEYKLSRTVQHVTVPQGTARTPLTTQHVVAGLALRVGAPRRTPAVF